MRRRGFRPSGCTSFGRRRPGSPRHGSSGSIAPFAQYGPLAHHWNPTVLSSLYQGASATPTTPVAANNDRVGCWLDTVAQKPLFNTIAGNRATYHTNSQNGLPTIDFATGQILTAVGPANGVGGNDLLQAVPFSLPFLAKLS